jgi:hypothetical protein
LNGSPDRPDPKSLPESSHNAYQPAIKMEPKSVSKRPLDSDIKLAAKTRVHGPKYVGPQVCDSDETSDEEANFEKFKMVTRITKIVEFHHAAALADIDLALGILNGRRAKQLGKAEEELKVVQHEKRMLELQTTKENERKAIVAAERKKRRDELRSRSILRDPIQAADSANYDALFDPSTFQIDVDVTGGLVLRREAASGKMVGNHVNGLSSGVPQVPMPETLGVHNQNIGRETPSVSQGKQSAWKMKSTPSALSQIHPVHDKAATPIPERMADVPWSSTSPSPLAHSVSLENGDFHIPGGFPVESKAKVASGWGKKPSQATVSALGSSKKADERPITAVSGVNRISPPVEPERPASPALPSSKKPNKKQRQANKKSGAANSSEVETSSSPAIAITASSSKTSISGPSTVEQEELPSTPRANVSHMMTKKQGLALGMGKPTSVIRGDDPASTPRPSVLKRPTTTHDPTESTADEETPWERMMRKKAAIPDPHIAESFKQETPLNRAAKQKPQVQDHRGINFSASTSSAVEEETPWERMTRLKAQTQAPQSSLDTGAQISGEEEETHLQRAMRSKGQNQGASKVPPNPLEDETPWERTMRLKGQSQISRVASSSTTKPMTMEESESPWEQMTRKMSQQSSEKFATTSARPQTGAAPSNLWHSEYPDDYEFPISPPDFPSTKVAPPPMRQSDREYWLPAGCQCSSSIVESVRKNTASTFGEVQLLGNSKWSTSARKSSWTHVRPWFSRSSIGILA